MSRGLSRLSSWLLLAALGCGGSTPPDPAIINNDPAQAVELVVDFGDGEKKSHHVPWAPDLTVLAAMERAENSSELVFSHRHAGEMAFLDAIGATKNETGRGARSWIYYVNGEEADVGFGARRLKPGDVVLWRFQKSKYNPDE